MGDFMYQRLDGLHLAHTRANHDPLFLEAGIALCCSRKVLHLDRQWRYRCQAVKYVREMLYFAGQLRGPNIGQLSALCLAYVKNRCHFEAGNWFKHRFYQRLTVRPVECFPSFGVFLFIIDRSPGRTGGQNLNALFVAFDLSPQFLPCSISGHTACGWTLQ